MNLRYIHANNDNFTKFCLVFDVIKVKYEGMFFLIIGHHFTLHSLVDLFILAPTELIWEALSHSAITHKYYSVTFPPPSIGFYREIAIAIQDEVGDSNGGNV